MVIGFYLILYGYWICKIKLTNIIPLIFQGNLNILLHKSWYFKIFIKHIMILLDPLAKTGIIFFIHSIFSSISPTIEWCIKLTQFNEIESFWNYTSVFNCSDYQEPPSPWSHTWRPLMVPDWSLGGWGHLWQSRSSWQTMIKLS